MVQYDKYERTMSDLIRGRTYEPSFPLIATAIIYYLIIWIFTALLRRVFHALNNRNRKNEQVLKNRKTEKTETEKE